MSTKMMRLTRELEAHCDAIVQKLNFDEPDGLPGSLDRFLESVACLRSLASTARAISTKLLAKDGAVFADLQLNDHYNICRNCELIARHSDCRYNDYCDECGEELEHVDILVDNFNEGEVL